MKNLQQAIYEDDNGRPFEAAKVDCLASYGSVCDGFYNWTCGRCGKRHGDRWWSISGRVVKCDDSDHGMSGPELDNEMKGCGAMNLLVRTNTTEVTEALVGLWKSVEMAKENERLKDIVKFNAEQLRQIRSDVMHTVEQALIDAIRKHSK